METFTYKCPNCGSNVNFDNNRNKWICKYCNNEFDALFATGDNKLAETLKDKNYKATQYKCNNCGSNICSINEISKCPKCSGNVTTNNNFVVNDILKINKDIKLVENEYKRSIKSYRKYISKEYDRPSFETTLIDCSLYNGYVRISDGVNIVKYVFINLLVPNLEYEDYKFMYEISNMKYSAKNMYVSKDILDDTIVEYGDIIKCNENVSYNDDFISCCRKDYMEKFNIKDENSLVIDSQIAVKEGIFIPFYVSLINDKYQYVLGNLDGKMKLNPVLTFNELDDVRNKIRKYPKVSDFMKKFSNIFVIVSILTFILSFYVIFNYYVVLLDKNIFNVYTCAFIVMLCMVITAIINVISILYKNKYLYCTKCVKLTKDEYLKQVITNSSNVKIVRW